MILATLNEGGKDGTLLVVDATRRKAVRAPANMPTLQAALDFWEACEPALRQLSEELNNGRRQDAIDLDESSLMAPLPRPFAFYDAACYPEHISVIRKARGSTVPSDFLDKPLMYQSVASPMMGPTDPIRFSKDEDYGVDLEAEVIVITGEVPQGTAREEAPRYIRLLGLINDVSLRHFTVPDLSRGFGFLHSKPASAMSPFLVTPDELGDLWNGQMMTGGSYRIRVRNEWLGDLDPGKDVAFDYCDLIAHAAKTRVLSAGSMLAAGTLANKDRRHGSGCIAEQRAREQLTEGAARTAYLRFGDEVYMELFGSDGCSVFGAIRQTLRRLE